MIMTIYLATELKEKGIAANVIFPGHTRSTGSDEQEGRRKAMRAEQGLAQGQLRRLKPTTVVPVALWLAEKPATLKKTYGFYRTEIRSALAHGVNVVAGQVVLPEVAQAHGMTAVPLEEVLP